MIFYNKERVGCVLSYQLIADRPTLVGLAWHQFATRMSWTSVVTGTTTALYYLPGNM